jgi:hypothetical protein
LLAYHTAATRLKSRNLLNALSIPTFAEGYLLLRRLEQAWSALVESPAQFGTVVERTTGR